MKREIKFRAWCEGTHEGLTFSTTTMEYGVTLSPKGNYCEVESGWDIHGEYPTVPIMQFTGLTDKNGKEIYEGDIVELKTNYHTKDKQFGWQNVEIFFDNLQYLCKNNLGQIYDLQEETDEGSYSWEVIGNIYENPELL